MSVDHTQTVDPTAGRFPSTHWIADCMKYRGKILTGIQSHWCADWDDLPIDETCDEWPCACPGAEALR